MVWVAPSSAPDAGHTPVMGEPDREEARSLSLRGVRPPVRVPGYEQESFLGKGAYGEVWVAVDGNSGRKVAIKYYTRRGGTDWAALAREVEKLRYLFNDRYVVQLIKVGWEAEPPYYVMEYLENGSLEDLLRHGSLSVHDAVPLFRDIAKGLVHAHDKGILHCDLKPANVLLDQDRHPRLADFGQSRLTNELSPALGTLFYMAPEQADLKSAPDARWDVYSLGAVMYRMLTGHPPYRDDAGIHTVLGSGTLEEQLQAYRTLLENSPPPAKHRKAPGVDSGLAAIVSKCLAPNPRHRYPNPQAVLTDLDAWSLRRVRRPLLLLTGITFTALLVVMALIGSTLFRDTVGTAEHEVLEGAIESNRFAAHAAAERFEAQAQYRWQSLETAARDPQLRKWMSTGAKAVPGDSLDAWLASQKQRYDSRVEDASSVWFAVNRDGLQLGTAPPFPQHRLQYRGFRDYFHGQGRQLGEKDPVPPIIRGPTRSGVFKRRVREHEEYWSVAFSVPVWPADEPGGEPIGVIGLNLDLKGATRLDGDRERFAVLIDTRPDSIGRPGLVLRHPYLERYKDEPPGSVIPVHYADDVVNWANGGKREFADEREYRDPVGGEFAGDWIASLERIAVRLDSGKPVDTGWVVLIQERREDVLRPVDALKRRLGFGAGAAIAVVLVLVLLMWAGMMSVVDASSRSRVSRMLRKWAGLPPTGGGFRTAGST
ncbi:MAG: serine/threonine protein kinase [Gemmataceae bacterium]